MPSWILAIDFGTSYTVAAARVDDRAPEVIEISGERRMPSVVLIDERGAIVVGRQADDLSGAHPDRTLRALKNRLGDQAPVVLAGRPFAVVTLVASFLRHVYAESVRHMGSVPRQVLLTHPATWNQPRRARLLEAATQAGIAEPTLVAEPVAAALSFAADSGLSGGGSVAIYDLGGGTFDTAVVTADRGELVIAGRPAGDQHIGGELFDEIIANRLGEDLPPDAWDAIQTGAEPLWQQIGATLRNESRKAKEIVSGSDYADLILPLPSGLQRSRLTRATFDELVRPYIAETVHLLERCVDDAGVSMGNLAGVSLVGGASRSPIVEQMTARAFPNVPMIRRGDPKTAVATGATLYRDQSASRRSQPSHCPALTSSTPPAPPVSQPPALPVSQPPAPPASRPPVPPPPRSAVSAPVDTKPGPARDGRHKRTLIVAAAVVAVVVLIGGIVALTGGDDAAPSGPPSRAQMDAALLPIREVRLTLGTDWDVNDSVAEQDPFCEQFNLSDPVRTRRVLFTNLEPGTGIGGADVTNLVEESITAFATDAEAITRFTQDEKISEQCPSASTTLDGVEFTYTLSNTTRQAARAIDAEVIALRYDVARVDDPGTIVGAGYVVESRLDDVIVSVNGLIFGREAKDEDVDALLQVSDVAIRYAAERLG